MIKYLHQHIEIAKELVNQYKIDESTLLAYLKTFFKKNKKFGSKDRKQIQDIVFNYFRLGNANHHLTFEQKAVIALFLKEEKEAVLKLMPTWGENLNLVFEEKLKFLKQELHFDWQIPFELSENIALLDFQKYMLSAAYTFLHLKKMQNVNDKIPQAEFISDTLIKMPSSTKVEAYLDAKDYWVMDMSSQLWLHFFDLQDCKTCWDCCAGAGGKSLLLKEKYPKLEILASDNRTSSLYNLQKRFELYDFALPEMHVLNLEHEVKFEHTKKFDCIIADVPCSGSGTWRSSPEQYYFFERNNLIEYVERQQKILEHIAAHIAPGGKIIYTTCSIFQEENEMILQFAQEKLHWKLQNKSIISAMNLGGNALFIAEFSI